MKYHYDFFKQVTCTFQNFIFCIESTRIYEYLGFQNHFQFNLLSWSIQLRNVIFLMNYKVYQALFKISGKNLQIVFREPKLTYTLDDYTLILQIIQIVYTNPLMHVTNLLHIGFAFIICNDCSMLFHMKRITLYQN
jgi:hypothetical protein